MSGYVPQVGDRVCERNRPLRLDVFTVLAADGDEVWLRHDVEGWRMTTMACDWEPYVEPVVYPERWINVYPHGCHLGHMTRSLAEEGKSDGRIGVLHLLPDGSTVMEAP